MQLLRDNDILCTCEKATRNKRKQSNVLLDICIKDFELELHKNESNYSFHLKLNDEVIAKINRKPINLVNTFHVHYTDDLPNISAHLLLFFVVIAIDTSQIVLFDNIGESFI